jgi:hypothetical protein
MRVQPIPPRDHSSLVFGAGGERPKVNGQYTVRGIPEQLGRVIPAEDVSTTLEETTSTGRAVSQCNNVKSKPHLLKAMRDDNRALAAGELRDVVAGKVRQRLPKFPPLKERGNVPVDLGFEVLEMSVPWR